MLFEDDFFYATTATARCSFFCSAFATAEAAEAAEADEWPALTDLN